MESPLFRHSPACTNQELRRAMMCEKSKGGVFLSV
jgi:hypothetical protein